MTRKKDIQARALDAIAEGADTIHIASLIDQSLAIDPVRSMLTSGDAKTSKGEDLGYRTGILYLAPHWSSGFNVCPMASPGCSDACLYKAGRGQMLKTQYYRLRKTRFLINARRDALKLLRSDIRKVVAYAKKHDMTPAIRLNGTSDLPWQSESFGALPRMFPEVQFYGYTKVLKNLRTQPNYHQTFSLSETNKTEALKALELGHNVAVVFDKLPETWHGRSVVDGDKHDLTFLHEPGTVLGLKAKGPAKHDKSGFVQLTRKGA